MLPTIRSIRIDEIRNVIEFTMQFKSAFLEVDLDYCSKRYEQMFKDNIAEIFVLEKCGKLIGSLGFIKAPDVLNGRLTFIEMFWFVDPESRGDGLKLFRHFEKYAKECGAKQIAMIHLSDSYPEKLKRLYLRSGYKLVENHYIKYVGE